MTQVGQDILHRPADTGRRAVPIVRLEGAINSMTSAQVSIRQRPTRSIGRSIGGSIELILRTSFLASPHMLRSHHHGVPAGRDRLRRATTGGCDGAGDLPAGLRELPR